jgi:hypothetical protein
VKPTPAYRAILELERRSAARLAALHADFLRLGRARRDIIALSARSRRSLLARSSWSALECAAISAHTIWVAAAAADLSAAQRIDGTHAAKIAQERMHWAGCRRGLERRAARETGAPWRD